MNNRLRIIVLGYIIRGPLGGMTWHHLQYVVGLHRMGHDVYFLEDSADYPSCYQPLQNKVDSDPAFGLGYAGEVFSRVGLHDRWAYWDAHTGTWWGPAGNRVTDILKTTDVILNISGVNPIRPWMEGVPARIFIDTDPAFTQIGHIQSVSKRALAERHTHHFTFAENMAASTIPHDGFSWQPTRQPVVMDLWPEAPPEPDGAFSTVMQWDSYDERVHNGVRYGMKSQSFAEFIDIPSNGCIRFEIALGGKKIPREHIRDHGWHLVDPLETTRTPWSYQEYLQRSKGEFSVAKEGYVVSRSGWFSERSTGYMASGRPVVLQDTGFSRFLPTGHGLFSFRSIEDVKDALERIESNYEHHCRAAREIVSEYFDSETVLKSLLNRLGN